MNSGSLNLQFGLHIALDQDRHRYLIRALRATRRLLLLHSVAITTLGRGGFLLDKLFQGILVVHIDHFEGLLTEFLLPQSMQVLFNHLFVELGATAAAECRSNLIDDRQHLFLVLKKILVQMLSLSTIQLRVFMLFAEVNHLADQIGNGFLDEVTVFLHLLKDNLLLPEDVDILLNGRPAILERLHLPVGLLLVVAASWILSCKVHFPLPVSGPICLKINRVDIANTVHVELLPLDRDSDVLHFGISWVGTDELVVGLVDRVIHVIHAEGRDSSYFGFRDISNRCDSCGIVHLHVLDNQHVVGLALVALRRPEHQVVVSILKVNGVVRTATSMGRRIQRVLARRATALVLLPATSSRSDTASV